MGNNKILIIEDEIYICDILCHTLKKEGYDVMYSLNGEDGLLMIEDFNPSLIILDVMLPGIGGFDLCKKSTMKHNIPIIMLTARNDIVDKILGLELGADDYITKPFDLREVVARVKTALRKNSNFKECKNKIIYINELVKIDPSSRRVYFENKDIKLKPKEYDLLFMLCKNRNKVFTRDNILDAVWGYDFEGSLRTVDVHIQRIRKKLDLNNANSIIETVFSVGYIMRCYNENIDKT